MKAKGTREPQYNRALDIRDKQGVAQLGLAVNQAWLDNPRQLAFILARYKFVSKMLSGTRRVLEVGCGDAFGTRLVRQEVPSVTAIDFDRLFIEDAKARMDPAWPVDARVHDMVSGPLRERFDAAYSLDVLEHIPRSKEGRFVSNIARSLPRDGVLIIGTPSLQSQVHASPPSKAGHVNCKDHQGLRRLLGRFFRHVFLFSMNDEVVHTGFYPMAHYFFALCCTKR